MGFARQEYWSGSPFPSPDKAYACMQRPEGGQLSPLEGQPMQEARQGPGRVLSSGLSPPVPGAFFPVASPLQHWGWELGVPVLRISMVTFPGVVCSASKESERLIMSLTKSCQFTAMNPVCKLKRRKASAQLSGHLVCPIVRHLRGNRLNLLQANWICET